MEKHTNEQLNNAIVNRCAKRLVINKLAELYKEGAKNVQWEQALLSLDDASAEDWAWQSCSAKEVESKIFKLENLLVLILTQTYNRVIEDDVYDDDVEYSYWGGTVVKRWRDKLEEYLNKNF